MSVSSYRFVSPGVQVQEIDKSQLPATSNLVGPTIIGRFEKGPALRPVYINSKAQLVEIFGEPVPGRSSEDVWRDGNYVGTMYAGYATMAWLTNTPAVNIIRLLGTENSNAVTAGKAGWQVPAYATNDSGGGAYGLFVMPSASAGPVAVTGTLAAIWYIKEGSVTLSGTLAGTAATFVSGTNVLVQSNAGLCDFSAVVTTPSGTYSSAFNLDVDSDKFIRRVFNTNPILTNSEVTAPGNLEYYWLGESFERSVDEIVGLSSATYYGFIAPLTDSTTVSYSKYRAPARPAESGWVIAQDLTTNTGSYSPAAQQKLFKFVGLDSGEWDQRNLKISISDIKPPATDFDDYGTFSVLVRLANDSDNTVKIVEQYNNVNLNPVSLNYIARKVGDKYAEWDETERRLREYGTYRNASRYFRLEMDADLDAGTIDPTYLPFGFFGPPRAKRFTFNSGSAVPSNTIVSASLARANNPSGVFLNQGTLNLTGSILFPAIPLRLSASSGLGRPLNSYFGITTGEKTAFTNFDRSYADVTRAFPSTFGNDAYDLGSETYRENSFIFSLDDVSGSVSGDIGNVYSSGSRAAGTSVTAVASLATGSQTGYRAILTAGYNQFTMPVYNGFDGFDIVESDPLRNTILTDLSSPTETNSYVYNTLNRAIDTISDPETLVTDVVAIPGMTYEALTTKLIQTCEARADALAIIDLPNVYIPEQEQYFSNKRSRYTGTTTGVAFALKERGLNSSYGATYYPWVQIRDTISNQLVFVPPSVVALGAMSYGQRTQELWFAPAGFTRGGLSEGRGGLPVLGVTHRLSSTERDTLYEANINPIAQFPSEGIVIFGQKTLQVTPSALDRINVRRLLIFLKREVSRIAANLLFDQNVKVTWARFLGQVNPFLGSVKTRLGLSDYRVILDKTTTTPDLVDRNILYAKVFLKPARSIEFIAIDFTITDSGASFID